MNQSQKNNSESLSFYNTTDNFKTIGKSYINSELRLQFYATTIGVRAHSSPRYALTTCTSIYVHRLDGFKEYRSSHSTVRRQNGMLRPTTIRPLESLFHLGPDGVIHRYTWLMARVQHLALHIGKGRRVHSVFISLSFSQGTQVWSDAETVGNRNTESKNFYWRDRSLL
jgi:hypothetical protein